MKDINHSRFLKDLRLIKEYFYNDETDKTKTLEEVKLMSETVINIDKDNKKITTVLNMPEQNIN